MCEWVEDCQAVEELYTEIRELIDTIVEERARMKFERYQHLMDWDDLKYKEELLKEARKELEEEGKI